MSNSPHSATTYLGGWLRLVRLPNLLTVPGDVLAGVAVMVCAPGKNMEAPPTIQIVAACVASLLLYIAGLLFNDLIDQKRDARERPSRPLPSGAVPRSHVIVGLLASSAGAILLGALMLPLAAFGVEIVLLGTILIYNVIKQNYPLTGGIVMGLCRGLNLLLGAAILTDGLWESLVARAVPVAACWTIYILVVTLVAQRETTGQVKRELAYLPVVTLLAFAAVYYFVFLPTQAATFALMCIPLVLAILLAAWSAYRISHEQTPAAVQKSIGTLIRNLILMQSAACVCWDLRLAAALLALWPVNYLLCRWFYAS